MMATPRMLAALLLLSGGAAAAAQSCGAVKVPAPCGLPTDDEAKCVARGCCYDAAAASYLGKTPCFYAGGDLVNITTVHVVQASHFDAGFAQTTVGILNLWFNTHFPRGYAIGLALDALGGDERLKFMTQSWLVSLYLDCPPNIPGLQCPSPAALANFSDAVKRGYLTWHAFPHNAELELAEPSMLSFALNMTHELDDAFGQRRKTVLSQRDVPGMTRSMIPVMTALGLRMVSVGVNGASTPPVVPRAFLWRDGATGTSLPSLWHGLGYGGIGFDDAVILPGLDQALVFDWRGDNAGPPESVAEVQGDWKDVRGTFPGARVVASTFDDWADALLASPAAMAALPAISSEMGDTWIHGGVSDPQKHAWNRLGLAARAECLQSGLCDIADPAFRNFSRLFVKNIEHTWGMDVKTFLHDTGNWTNAELAAQLARNASNFVTIRASWQEQRDFGFTYPLQALGSHPLRAQLEAAFGSVYPPPAPPSPRPQDGWTPIAPGQVINAGRFSIAFDGATGAISYLSDAVTGQVWADGSKGALMGVYHYQTYTQADYDAFIANYSALQPPPSWFSLDFGKPNVSSAQPVHQELDSTQTGMWTHPSPEGTSVQFLVASSFGSSNAHTYYGAPGSVFTLVDVSTAQGDNTVRMTLSTYNKTATRLPEAIFFRFNVTQDAAPASWYAGKLGSWVDVNDTVGGGNQKMHGVLQGIRAVRSSGANTMTVSSPQAGLAVFGHPFGLPQPWEGPPSPLEGAAFVLSNNNWGTNYIMWSPWGTSPWGDDANQQWRFDLTFE